MIPPPLRPLVTAPEVVSGCSVAASRRALYGGRSVLLVPLVVLCDAISNRRSACCWCLAGRSDGRPRPILLSQIGTPVSIPLSASSLI
jgi:hypothetical protein